jgi:hypothetical protein
MEAAITAYYRSAGGVRLWKPEMINAKAQSRKD